MRKILTYLFVSLLLPASAHAATFHFSTLQDIPRGGEGVITLRFDTEGEKVNAVSGEIAIPQGVEVGPLITGQSALVLWVEQPKVLGGKVRFSGMTPGGFQGDVELFSFVARPLLSSSSVFSVSLPEANRNDVDGTPIKPASRAFVLRPSSRAGTDVVIDDRDAPEPFAPILSSDPSLFDGRPFVSFAAQDKGSGVIRYEWASSYFLPPRALEWKPAESPLELAPGLLWKEIHIRAIDAVGNTTEASVASARHYAVLWFGAILVIFVLCVLFSFARPSSYRSS